jgi:hypothetical protein
MSIDSIIGLGFIFVAMFGHLIIYAIHYGVFDAIAIKLTNFIVKRIERLEKGDI